MSDLFRRHVLDIKFGIAKPPAANSAQISIVREDNESRIENTCHLIGNVNSSENLKSVIDFCSASSL